MIDPGPSRHAILVRGLRKVYPGRTGPVVAVDGLDLDVFPGECFGLLGPNGAGKTTTIEILEGLSEPTDGEVEVLGRRWATDADEIRQRIGVTLQETRFPEKMTVRELLRLFRSFYRSGPDPDTVMPLVSLESKADAYVETLSGGQQRRLAVALALVGDPELLFFDEPTTGLDPQARRQLWDVIRDLRQKGRSIVLTTHYMDEAERLCDRIAIVDHGKVIALGTPDELIARLGGEHIVEFALGSVGVGGDGNGNGGDAPALTPDAFASLPTVASSRAEGDGFALTVGEPHAAIPALLDLLDRLGRPLLRLTTRRVSLEDVFVALTGRHLRDDGPEGTNGEAPAGGRGRRRRARAG
ncbi:ABC transporter ATP-binding protein [Tautonia sociabilis]|uniref:ABC transporter ATP-binding protein n=1 Tax=Tautonia sociabilis TaxID=2080755 RepID=A0A432MPZ0_9BACT|nr:ABC transporter ATP-binding protein [Tautonia sociabilis]RUL89217.1 ABC transporter ATP-binding protein [Tautonia sociabilis]